MLDPISLTPQSLVDRKKRVSYTRILSHLFEKGSSSIAKLAKELHTSVPSVTAMLDDLIKSEWVIEMGAAKTKSGRRPVYYDLNPKKKIILVLDVNIYQTNFVFIDLRNEIVTKTTFRIDLESKDYLKKIIHELDQLLQINPHPWAIGISAPGLIETSTGFNHTHLNVNLGDKSLAEVLEEKYDLPVFSINDTRASLLGEHHYGFAKNKSNVLLINLDWGVGLGILHNGQIVEGSAGFAGELGHVQIVPDGELCHCGKVGCLDTISSAASIVRKANRGLADNKPTSLAEIKGDVTLADVIHAAIHGDEFCIDIIYEVGSELGKGLTMAVHLFNPEVIIIDGILKNAGDLIVSTIRQSIHKYCLAPFKSNLDIVISPLGEDSKVFGTKAFTFKNMMALYRK
ncbi:ROK family transcriptional regulator [Marinilongibacter aquaticus]|uniref:ROK family transcriptional regulator n=1 Tax=Marinilongibacter aquaticus TaxID=2975157 RepID=UPI0021BD7879|nr:ROK family transcriptional regulator [Marinilongibacter aquaticus]UBM58463.1 ROK family transcriptional regulator [Marinilongibacter aquaticus]